MPIEVTLIGGGMIVQDQILPSLYQVRRSGLISRLTVCEVNSTNLRVLAGPRFTSAFPDQGFEAMPPLETDPSQVDIKRYQKVVAGMRPGNMVVVAVPDHLHFELVMYAVQHNQHVLCVKPLAQSMTHAKLIEDEARKRGVLVAVEYHKRFDRRALEARGQYRAGRFGEFKVGQASLIEPFFYRHSNFQNWFTKDKSDPFSYVGCHYVDLVYFITGLRPTAVSVVGVEGTFPNGNVGYMWSSGQVVWENGAVLNLLNGLGYPDQGAGSNDQWMSLFCEGNGRGAVIKHDDQFRGVSHAYIDETGGRAFRFINPDYFRLVPWNGPGLRPVGYGYDSVEAAVQAAIQVSTAGPADGGDDALHRRQAAIEELDQRGLLATPANSAINELAVEAGRLSLAHAGQFVDIEYHPQPRVVLRGLK
jgi:D-galacturonate reductase